MSHCSSENKPGAARKCSLSAGRDLPPRRATWQSSVSCSDLAIRVAAPTAVRGEGGRGTALHVKPCVAVQSPAPFQQTALVSPSWLACTRCKGDTLHREVWQHVTALIILRGVYQGLFSVFSAIGQYNSDFPRKWVRVVCDEGRLLRSSLVASLQKWLSDVPLPRTMHSCNVLKSVSFPVWSSGYVGIFCSLLFSCLFWVGEGLEDFDWFVFFLLSRQGGKWTQREHQFLAVRVAGCKMGADQVLGHYWFSSWSTVTPVTWDVPYRVVPAGVLPKQYLHGISKSEGSERADVFRETRFFGNLNSCCWSRLYLSPYLCFLLLQINNVLILVCKGGKRK